MGSNLRQDRPWELVDRQPPSVQTVDDVTSSVIAPRNKSRRYILIVNLSVKDTLWIQLNGTAVADECIPIPLGGFYEPNHPPAEEIQAIAYKDTIDLLVYEGE